MKAAVYDKYGPLEVLGVQDVSKPPIREDGVLVEIHSASVNYANPALIRGKPFMIRLMTGALLKPKYRIPGGDIAGRVVEVGQSVELFKPGDEVYGDLSSDGFGGFAEYVVAPERALWIKPANINFHEASAVPQAGLVALQGLRKAGIKPGQKTLIVGASGGIGTFAIQLAKYFGTEVTGVCSTRNLELVLSLGADHVIDYTREDFSRSNQKYDIVLATAGYRSIFDYRKSLSPEGVYIMAGGSMSQVFQAMAGPLIALGSKKIMRNLYHQVCQRDLDFMKKVIEAGKVKPVIDRVYTLDDIIEALGYYEKGRSRGKVVISLKY